MSSMAAQEHNRSDFPYASDADVLQLFTATKIWLTAHGHCFMEGEIFGFLPEMRGDTLVAGDVMSGTDAVDYHAMIEPSTLSRYAPTAASILEVTDALYVSYEEPFYKITTDKPPEYMNGIIWFRAPPLLPKVDKRTGGAFYIVADRQGGVFSHHGEYDKNYKIAFDNTEPEIKTHEHAALTQVIEGLGALTRTHRFRRSLKW